MGISNKFRPFLFCQSFSRVAYLPATVHSSRENFHFSPIKWWVEKRKVYGHPSLTLKHSKQLRSACNGNFNRTKRKNRRFSKRRLLGKNTAKFQMHTALIREDFNSIWGSVSLHKQMFFLSGWYLHTFIILMNCFFLRTFMRYLIDLLTHKPNV